MSSHEQIRKNWLRKVRKQVMNSVFSLTGAAHWYRRKDSAAEIRAGERKNILD